MASGMDLAFSYSLSGNTPPLKIFVGDSESNRKEWRREVGSKEYRFIKWERYIPANLLALILLCSNSRGYSPLCQIYFSFEAQPLPLNLMAATP